MDYTLLILLYHISFEHYFYYFLDILLLCKKIITITRANPVDDFKQKQFEAVLRDSGYEEICLKTTKLMMPDLRDKRSLDACIKEIVKGEEL